MDPSYMTGEARGVSIDVNSHRLARRAGYRAGQLAELHGVSLRTLERHFRARYGMTVSHWIKAIRMQEAVDRIRSGEGVKDIAFDLGYKQLSHFSREFKRTYGAPPSRLANGREYLSGSSLALRS